MVVLEGSFYGRTYRPARLSHSCRSIYQQHLASFQHEACHLPVAIPPNDIDALHKTFDQIEKMGYHVEAMYMEPVMGEHCAERDLVSLLLLSFVGACR
jgi:hypothetical protein